MGQAWKHLAQRIHSPGSRRFVSFSVKSKSPEVLFTTGAFKLTTALPIMGPPLTTLAICGKSFPSLSNAPAALNTSSIGVPTLNR